MFECPAYLNILRAVQWIRQREIEKDLEKGPGNIWKGRQRICVNRRVIIVAVIASHQVTCTLVSSAYII